MPPETTTKETVQPSYWAGRKQWWAGIGTLSPSPSAGQSFQQQNLGCKPRRPASCTSPRYHTTVTGLPAPPSAPQPPTREEQLGGVGGTTTHGNDGPWPDRWHRCSAASGERTVSIPRHTDGTAACERTRLSLRRRALATAASVGMKLVLRHFRSPSRN